MKTDAETRRALAQYADAVRRVCCLHLSRQSDVEDVFQEVFLKHALHDALFESEAHERAWLLRVAINACRDMTKSVWSRLVFPLDEAALAGTVADEGHREVLWAVLRLKPPRYRDALYLHYYEGYKAAEIATILNTKENTVYTWLDRARKQLKTRLGDEWNEQ